jgi:hypothetical protein
VVGLDYVISQELAERITVRRRQPESIDPPTVQDPKGKPFVDSLTGCHPLGINCKPFGNGIDLLGLEPSSHRHQSTDLGRPTGEPSSDQGCNLISCTAAQTRAPDATTPRIFLAIACSEFAGDSKDDVSSVSVVLQQLEPTRPVPGERSPRLDEVAVMCASQKCQEQRSLLGSTKEDGSLDLLGSSRLRGLVVAVRPVKASGDAANDRQTTQNVLGIEPRSPSQTP